MSKVITDNKHYTDIANAIREKNGSTDTYHPSQMADAIKALPVGVSTGTELYVLGMNETHGTSIDFNKQISGVYCFIDSRNNGNEIELGYVYESDTNAEVVYLSVEKAQQENFWYLSYTGSTTYPIELTSTSIAFIDPYGSKFYVIPVYA